MRRSERLEPVRDVAAEAERRAATALAAAETRLAEAEAKLAELERYAQEYRASLQRKTSGGIDAAQLRAYHGFIGRLGDAIDQQRVVARRANEERDLSRARWMDASRRARAVGKAVEHAAREERHVEERREQNDVDERAQRAFIASARDRHDAPARRSGPEES